VPDAERSLRIVAAEKAAAGPRAVAHSLRTALGAMGPLRTARTLRRVNQKDGFACPSCAWPESDDHHVADFCEQGVKAVAEEAMKARLTRTFFERYDINELAEQSDYWLGQRGRLTEPMVKHSGSDRYEPIGWDDAFGMIA
jgi:formate dehydrogenase major subunit